MSYRLICDGSRSDRFCPAEETRHRWSPYPESVGWVRTKSGKDLCPAHAKQAARRRENARVVR